MPTGIWTALHDEKGELLAEAQAILSKVQAEGRSYSEDEAKRDDEINARLEQIGKDLEREDRIKAQLSQAAGRMPEPTRKVGRDLALDKPWGFDTYGMTPEAFIAKSATYHVPETHALHPATRYQNAADGEFLRAVFAAAKGYGTDPRLVFQSAAQGAGEFVGADGGFLLPSPSETRLRLRMTQGEVLSRVQKDQLSVGNSIDIAVNAETSRATGSRHGAVQGYRLDEGGTITASRPKLSNLGFKLHKYAALGYATDELLQDASLMGRIIFDAFGDELRFMAEDDIINGSGTGTPQGLLNAAALVSVAKETNQTATTLLYENIIKMWSRCYASCRPNCVWLINQDVEPQLYSMSLAVGTGGVPVFLPASGASGSPYATLMGRPVVATEYNASLGTKGDIILTDLSEYWFFDKGEPQQASSIHVAFTTDEQAFRVTYRADGRCSWISALTPYKGTANTRSCCVALDTRS